MFVLVLKEDMADLKEQITLYESAVKHGVVALDLSSEWDHHLSESCLDLGFKKAKRKNGILHRCSIITPLSPSASALSEPVGFHLKSK